MKKRKRSNCRDIFLYLLLSMLIFSAKSQNNCPLNIRVTTTVGTCYNNCGIRIDLRDNSGNPLDTADSDLSNIKYYCINQSTNDTVYSYLNSFTVFPGTYTVGAQAACRTNSTNPDSLYILLDTHDVVTTTTSYVTPVLSMINNTASTPTAYGTVNSFPCENTGRVQLKITGGSYPYYVQVCDEHETPIDTIIFSGPMYAGTSATSYDYKDHYSIENLAPGKYFFFVWDDCDYHLPKVWQTVGTANPPYISNVCWYNAPVTFADSNTFKFDVSVNSASGYYASYIPDAIEYRIIYPEINGIADTTAWKRLPAGSYTSTNTTITLMDTAFLAHAYCDLHNKSIKLESRSTICAPNPKTYTYTVPSLYGNYISYDATIVADSSKTVQIEYDSCGYWGSRTTRYGYQKYRIRYLYSHSPYSTSCYSNYNYYKQYYTYPLYWVYTDTTTHQIIKIDTIATINTDSYLDSSDVIPLYGDFKTTPYTLPIQRTLYDGKGCELYSRFDALTFKQDIFTSGGTRYDTYFYGSRYSYGNYCCSTKRSFYIEERNTLPMSYHGDCKIELISSPGDNKYNFTATFSQETKQWTVIKEDISNLADITLFTTYIRAEISDYCLMSGAYTFRITTPCSTYVYTCTPSFYDTYEYATIEEPVYELTPNCTELIVKPTAGKYSLTRSNTYNSGANVNQPWSSTSDLTAYFNVVSGPTGGYTNTTYTKNQEIRFTMPGTYVIRMYPSDNTCTPEIFYDTIRFNGGTVEYKYDIAYVCDSLSTTGYVRVKGKNGTEPYNYTLYSGPELTGSILAENNTGIFNDVPIRDGQKISVKIQDDCMASFPISFYVFDLTKTDKCWFQSGAKTHETCEGSFVNVYALDMEDEVSYEWTGPNGFIAHTQNAQVFIPRNAQSGWYKVTLHNTGCQLPVTDSIYLTVIPAPKVNIAEDATICPGENVTLTYTASGNGDVNYTIGHEENSVVTYQNYTNNNGFSYQPNASGIFWVNAVSDGQCSYNIPEDTVHIILREKIATSCDVITIPDSICLDSNAVVFAYSELELPYTIRWYRDYEQTELLKAEVISSTTGRSEYPFTALAKDTSIYVTVSNADYCETQYGTILNWMNLRAGTTELRCGESIRFYDSGGSTGNYSSNENIVHTFTSSDGNPITLSFTKFNTENNYDKLLVFTGSTTNTDSLIANITGNRNSSLPEELTSDGNTLTVWFLSNGASQFEGWEATVSNNPKPAIATVNVSDTIRVTLDAITATPIHYNGDVTLAAVGSGGRNKQYEYIWETSPDRVTWMPYASEITDTSRQTFAHLTESQYVRVSITDQSANACGGTDTAIYYLPISNIKMNLEMNAQQDHHCSSTYTATLNVTNNGAGSAEDVVIKIQLPNDFTFIDGMTDTILLDTIASRETITRTIGFTLNTTYNTLTDITLKAQIWSCRQGDSVPSVVYGDWDWSGDPRQADEDASTLSVLPTFPAGAYTLITFNDTACLLMDAHLEAQSTIATPQYFNWYADNAMTEYLKTDTIGVAGESSTLTVPSVTISKEYFVSVGNDEACPTSNQIKNAQLIVKKPNVGSSIVSTNDTVCYDNTATLTASSAMGYPQYFCWWKNDKTTLLMSDTVLEGGHSTFNPAHQIQDSVYFITVHNDTTCPYFAEHALIFNKQYSEFLMAPAVANGTTVVHFNDSIGFFDEGGKNNNYSTHNVNFTHTFTAEPGEQVQLVITAFNSQGTTSDWMRIYDGTSTSGTELALLGGALSSQMPKTFTSSTGSLTIQWRTNGSTVRSGWESVISIANSNFTDRLAQSRVHIKAPTMGSTIVSTNDTVCYDNTATLTASSAMGYPQYFCWWKNDKTTLLMSDTVLEGGHSTFNPAHQIQDSVYFITVHNDTTCPYLPGIHAVKTILHHSEFLMAPYVANGTTVVHISDSIGFFDEGGKNNDYSTHNANFSHTFTAEPGEQVQLVITAFNSQGTTSDWMRIYDGTSPSGTLLAALAGDLSSQMPKTYTSSTGSLTIQWKTNGSVVSSGWEGVISTGNSTFADRLAQSTVHIKSPNVGSSIVSTNDTVCYDNTATLTASSAMGYPQYFYWWKNDKTTLLMSDTVLDGNHSTFNPAHQIQDSVYFITVHNDTTCPYLPGIHVVKTILHHSEFLMNPSVANGTTVVHFNDSIGFFDEGGKNNNYGRINVNFTHTFTAEPGEQVQLVITAFNSEGITTDYMKIYDGTSTSGTQLALLGGDLSSQMPKTYTSSTGSLTIQWRTDGSVDKSGWEGVISTANNNFTDRLAQSTVHIKSPNVGRTIVSTNDTVCYDNTATLTASSAMGYPQYFYWWKNDKTTLLMSDTVLDGNHSTFNPAHQIQDSVYFITVHNDTSCPYLPEIHAGNVQKEYSEFLMNPSVTNGTTLVHFNDSIGFFDEGGKSGNYSTPNANFVHTFTAEPGEQVQLVITAFNSQGTSYDWMKIYDGTSTSGTELALLGGDLSTQMPKTYTSSTGSLTILWRTNSSSVRSGWESVISTANNNFTDRLAQSTVSIYDRIAPTSISHEVCQSTLPYTYQGFRGIDISEAGVYEIDSTFKSSNGCDSLVTLLLTVNSTYNQTEHATLCANSFPFTWRDTTFTAGTTSGNYVFRRQTIHGCDSIVTLALTVNPTVNIATTTYTVCPTIGTQTLTANFENVTADYTTTWQFNGSAPTEHEGISRSVTSDSYEITIPNTSCQEDYLYTVSFVDENGCQQTQTDTVKVRVTGELTFTGGTSAKTIQCASEAIAPHTITPSVMPTVTDGCGQTVTNYTSYTTPTSIDCEGDMTYDYTFEDCNGNESTWSFTYHLDRTTPPVVNATGFDNTSTVACINAAEPLSASQIPTATDICGNTINGVLTSTRDIPDPIECSGIRELTYTYNDCSGLSSTWTFTYTIRDSLKPVISSDVQTTMMADVNHCEYRIPSIADQIRSKATDNCTSQEELVITQLPSAGTIIPQSETAQSVEVTVTVTDACGNESQLLIWVNVPAKLKAEITPSIDTICYQEQTTLTAVVSGGTPTYLYAWSTSESTESITVAPNTSTTYTLIVTDSYGCSDTTSSTVIVKPAAMNMENHTEYLRCNGETFTVIPTGAFIPEGTRYVWTVDENADVLGQRAQTTPTDAPISQTLTNNSNTIQTVVYHVTPVTDGCAGDDFTITVNIEPTPVLTLNCPEDIYDTLEFGSCALIRNPEDLGTPSWAHSLGWVLIDIKNNAPSDNIYPEGDNVITWTMTDECGNTVSCDQHFFVIFPQCPDAVDYEGNVYHGVRIDCDCWTQRNLESTRYSDGESIPGIYNYYAPEYPNVLENVRIFGRLYDWESAIRDTVANEYGHIQGICPSGWYLPSAEQYLILNEHGAIALKSPDYWLDGGGNNSTGFTSLPAGYYDGAINRYMNLMGEAYYWSTTYSSGNWSASAVALKLNCSDIISTITREGLGYSIRCIKEKE